MQNSIKGIHYKTGKYIELSIAAGSITEINELPGGVSNGDMFIAPGLIDNQVNGYAGVDFSGNDLSIAGIRKAAMSLWKEGVTTFLPTLLTGSHEMLSRNFSILRKAVESDEQLSASIPGFHLEGPYISPEEGFRGCHPLAHIRKPSWSEFLTLQEAAGGMIMQVTLAPEADGAIEFISQCCKSGVVVAIGHTNASSDQISMAVDAGARLSTHLGNGCANMIHRHNNPIWPQLANDRLTPTLIADGHHLTKDELKVFYKTKGSTNIILTSDVIFLAGMAPGKYTFLESDVLLTEEGMLINTNLNCLAGASFPLKKGLENMIDFTGCQLSEAVDMASGNVARVYNMTERGNLVIGARADLILFKRKGNQIVIVETLLSGNKV